MGYDASHDAARIGVKEAARSMSKTCFVKVFLLWSLLLLLLCSPISMRRPAGEFRQSQARRCQFSCAFMILGSCAIAAKISSNGISGISLRTSLGVLFRGNDLFKSLNAGCSGSAFTPEDGKIARRFPVLIRHESRQILDGIRRYCACMLRDFKVMFRAEGIFITGAN